MQTEFDIITSSHGTIVTNPVGSNPPEPPSVYDESVNPFSINPETIQEAVSTAEADLILSGDLETHLIPTENEAPTYHSSIENESDNERNSSEISNNERHMEQTELMKELGIELSDNPDKFYSKPREFIDNAYNQEVIDNIKEMHFESHLKELFINMTEIANKYYPDRWDLYINQDNNTWMLLLYVPETTIKNNKNQSTELQELFFKIKGRIVEEEIKISGAIYGTRSKLTYKEYVKGYVHSHLTSSSLHSFTEFCLGSSTVDDILSELAYRNYNDELFEALLMQLPTLEQWESIDGVPYIYISKLNEPLGNDRRNISREDRENAFIRFLEIVNDEVEVVYDAVGHEFNFMLNDRIENILAECTDFHVLKDENDEFYSPSTDGEPSHADFKNVEFSEFMFRGTIVQQYVEGYESDFKWPENERKYAHRSIVEYIQIEYEQILNNLLKELIYEKTAAKTGTAHLCPFIRKDFVYVLSSER